MKKGSSVENAVRLIEEQILKKYISKRTKISIERNKIINHNGVHHEIDIYIELFSDDIYNSTFIIETKDWKTKKVGKNEIIGFNHKVEITNATKGIICARSFTKDAINQIKQSPRIEATKLYDEISGFLGGTPRLSHVETQDIQITPKYIIIGTVAPDQINSFSYKGRNIQRSDLFEELFEIQKIRKEKEDELLHSNDLGIHEYWEEREIGIEMNDLIINQKNRVEKVMIRIYFKFEVKEATVVSQYVVEKRGRVAHYEVPLPNGSKGIISLTSIEA